MLIVLALCCATFIYASGELIGYLVKVSLGLRVCILYFIQYYVLHCIDPVLKINVSKLFAFVVLMFLLLVDVVHTFYLQRQVFTFYHQIID